MYWQMEAAALACHLCRCEIKSHLVHLSAGLNLLLEMLQSFQHSDFATQFHKTYYLTLMREIFAVMTGNAHTSSKGATCKKSCSADFPRIYLKLVCTITGFLTYARHL